MRYDGNLLEIVEFRRHRRGVSIETGEITHQIHVVHEQRLSGRRGGRTRRCCGWRCVDASIALEAGEDDEFALEALIVFGQILQHENVTLQVIDVGGCVLEELTFLRRRLFDGILQRQWNDVLPIAFGLVSGDIVLVMDVDDGDLLLAVHDGHYRILGSRESSARTV